MPILMPVSGRIAKYSFFHVMFVFLVFIPCMAPDRAVANEWEPITLVTGNEYLPYSDEALQDGGLVTLIVMEVFRAANMLVADPEFKPWVRGLDETRTSKYDATFPYSLSEERAKHFAYSEALLYVEEAFFTRANVNLKQFSPQNLASKSICRPLGYNQVTLQRLSEEVRFRIESPHTLKQCFLMLARGRVDMVFIDEVAGWHAIGQGKSEFGNKFLAASMPDRIDKVGLHLIMAKSNPNAAAVIERFNQSLRTLKASGEMKLLIDNYLQVGDATEP
jgi:polar amino acid transport system substrate-binding protein